MARCEDCLHYEICEIMHNQYGISKVYPSQCGYYKKSADVAPRAEVEELIYRLECLLCHATGGRLSKHTYDLLTMETAVTDYLDESYCEGKEEGYKNAKAEVAAEIFNEITKMFFEKQRQYENSRQSGKARQMMVARCEVYKLQKKYTGNPNENRRNLTSQPCKR